MMLSLNNIFDSKTILPELAGTTKEEVFFELVDAIAAAHPECNQEAVLASLWEREKKLSTGIASGVAIPHAVHSDIGTIAGALGISRAGIEYDALDKKPVHAIFMLVMNESARENHLHILAQISTLVHTDAIAQIIETNDVQKIHAILSRFK